MPRATFLFHGDLPLLLAPSRRHGAFEYSSGPTDTLKHIIESLGVPHTEVGRVEADGVSASLDVPIPDGGWIDVFSSYTPLTRDNARFLLDGHLGRLVSRLRMLGFDTEYGKQLEDEQLAATAFRDARVLLTRDAGLLKRKEVERGCLIRSGEAGEQIRQVAARFVLAPLMDPFTRCLDCNTPLSPAQKADVQPLVPPYVFATKDRFSRCPGCGKVYWQGTHHSRMLGWMDDLAGSKPSNPVQPSESL